MESILESSVPIRFVFMMVGPSSSELNYTQIGRAMGALLADWVGENYSENYRLSLSKQTQIKMICPSHLIGVQSGSSPCPNWERVEHSDCWLHGLQHRDPSHWDPGQGNVGVNSWLPEEDAAWKTPSHWHPPYVWRSRRLAELQQEYRHFNPLRFRRQNSTNFDE